MRVTASRWLGMDDSSESNAFPRQSCAWNLLPLSPIDSASPESSNSARKDPNSVQPKFERGRAAVEREDSQVWFSICHTATLTLTWCSQGPAAVQHMAPCSLMKSIVALAEWSLSCRSVASVPVPGRWPRPSRRGRLALPIWLSLPLRLCLLELIIQIRAHSGVGHSSCCYLSPVDRHWPEIGGCTCAETALEAREWSLPTGAPG